MPKYIYDDSRHPSFEEVLRVLKHLNTIWKPEATVAYVLKCYENAKKEQEKKE